MDTKEDEQWYTNNNKKKIEYIADLCVPINDEEVKNPIVLMGPYKSLGLDGLPAAFYQHFWHVVGVDLINMVKHVFILEFLLK